MRLRICTVMVPVALMVTMGWAGLCGGEDVAIREDGKFPQDFLGGGDYVMAKAPSGDSWIAVVYGTGNQTVKSPITIVASWIRTLAGVEVHDASGMLLNRSRPVAVRSLLVHRFASLIEFNDTNGDGIGNVAVSNQPVAADQLVATEPVYKAVSLRQAWERGPVSEGTTTENGTLVRSLEFDLTATDLDYIVVGNRSATNDSPGDGKLNSLRFTLQLRVFIRKSTVSVPFYNISLSAVAAQTASATRLADRTYNVTTVAARAKTGHIIEGWDLEPTNERPRLMLGTATTFGWAATPAAAAWMTADFVQKTLGGGGTASFTREGGTEVLASAADDSLRSDDAPADKADMPAKAGARELRLADNWEKCGWLTWTSDVLVYENETSLASTGQAFYQVQGARRTALATDRGTYSGLLLLGGLSYPGAWKVVHDPELGADMGGVDIPWFGPPENHPPLACIISPKEGAQFKTTDNIRLDGTACSDADNDNLSYGWTEGNRTLGFSSIVSRKFAEGKHRVSLTIHDGRGGYATAVVNFTVKKESTPGFGAAAAGPAILCAILIAEAWRRRS